MQDKKKKNKSFIKPEHRCIKKKKAPKIIVGINPQAVHVLIYLWVSPTLGPDFTEYLFWKSFLSINSINQFLKIREHTVSDGTF